MKEHWTKQAVDELEVQSMSHKTYHRIAHGINKNKGLGSFTVSVVTGRESDGGVELTVQVSVERTRLQATHVLLCVPCSPYAVHNYCPADQKLQSCLGHTPPTALAAYRSSCMVLSACLWQPRASDSAKRMG